MMATRIMLSGLSDEYSIDSKDPFADLDSEHEGFATVSERIASDGYETDDAR